MNFKNIISPVLLVLLLSSFSLKKEEKLEITQKNLLGAYGNDEETENAYFGIDNDSIFYVDAAVSVKYELKKDTLVIMDPENGVGRFLILKLTTDSLAFNNLEYDLDIRLNRRKQ
ncbi:hypothetical protein EYV94_00995 [Puteibacter caeruleilacunae]|nr:hypothetical protein EYV94_00995 [Puteibacter caeruleilacunae]